MSCPILKTTTVVPPAAGPEWTVGKRAEHLTHRFVHLSDRVGALPPETPARHVVVHRDHRGRHELSPERRRLSRSAHRRTSSRTHAHHPPIRNPWFTVIPRSVGHAPGTAAFGAVAPAASVSDGHSGRVAALEGRHRTGAVAGVAVRQCCTPTATRWSCRSGEDSPDGSPRG